MEFSLDLREIQASKNVCELLSEEEANWIGRTVVEGYKTDRNSRKGWEEKYKEAQKLALQVVEHKTWPWSNASNVKFPLLTVATLQFAARAYGALIKGPEIVKCRVIGMDPQGIKKARASRVSQHMSYQVLEEDEPWEEEHDKLFMTLPIIGTCFTKSYYDPVKEMNCTETVLAWDLIVDYHAKSLAKSDRATHRFYLFEREIRERQLAGHYVDVEIGEFGQVAYDEEDDSGKDARQGLEVPTPERGMPRTVLEQHLYLDLDGDGYEEPYVATVERFSCRLLRLVHRFEEVVTEQSLKIAPLAREMNAQETDETRRKQLLKRIKALQDEKPDVLKIRPLQYFTKWGFIPSPDGGFYDLGFGGLIGPVNESVNTLINQLIDAGTLSNLQAGFIARGARVRGDTQFQPGEWKYVDVPGSDLKNAIVPLPVRDPSPVLFQMLGLLINYGERIASVTDIMVGENMGQNTPAYNAQQMLSQGMTVFTGIFKRLYRSMRDEFRLLYRLNRLYLKPEQYFRVLDGPSIKVLAADYMGDPTDVRPVADPANVLPEEKLRQAAILAQRASTVPGYNLPAVEARLLNAAGIEDVQEVYPTDKQGQPLIKPPINPELQIELAEGQRKAVEGRARSEALAREQAREDARAEAEIELRRAQTVQAYAAAGKTNIDAELARFDSMTKRIGTQVQAAKGVLDAEVTREGNRLSAESRRMAQKSGNGSGGAASE